MDLNQIDALYLNALVLKQDADRAAFKALRAAEQLAEYVAQARIDELVDGFFGPQ
jgi:hypothetical protein